MVESAEHVDLVEFAPSGRIKHGKIHRSLGIIEGATMIGPMSSNGTHRKRRYSTQALKKIAQEAEGLPGYLNHVKPEDAFKPRDVRDIAIRHRNVRYDPTTDSVKSDMHVMPNHADLVFALAENFGDHIGNSLVSKGAVTMEGDTEVVQDILAIRSADLVTDPASTKGLFEGAESRERPLSITDLIESIQNTKGDTKVELSTILAHLKDNEPDRNLLAEHFGWVNKASAEKLQESNKALTVKVAEQDKALTESIAKLAVSEKTLTETKAEVDTYKAKEAVAAKQAKLQETIAAHGLSKDFGKVEGVISESFVAILEGQDEAMWSKMLDDRYAALKSVPVTRSQSPKSDTKDLSESSNGLPSDIYARVAAMVGR
jgi:ubiquinone biosynthesis protein UbiJ